MIGSVDGIGDPFVMSGSMAAYLNGQAVGPVSLECLGEGCIVKTPDDYDIRYRDIRHDSQNGDDTGAGTEGVVEVVHSLHHA